MKKRKVNLHNAKKRLTTLGLKIAGWREAVKKNLIDARFANDIDEKKVTENLAQYSKIMNEVENVQQKNLVQSARAKKNLRETDKKIREDRKIELQKNHDEFQNAVEKAKIIRQQKDAATIEKAKTALHEVSAERDKLKNLANEQKKLIDALDAMHEKLGVSEKILDGILAAALASEKNSDLKNAILAGNAETIARIASEKNLI